MFPLCYICFTKIVQFEKRNSGDVQLIFIFTYKYSESEAKASEIYISGDTYRTALCSTNIRISESGAKQSSL